MTKYIFGGVVIFLVGIFVGYIICTQGVTKTKFVMDIPHKGKLTLDLEEDLESPEKLLDKLFSEEFTKAGVLGWLKKRDIMPISDIDIADEIKKCSFDFPISDEIRKIAENRQGPWSLPNAQNIRLSIPHEQPSKGNIYVCPGKYEDAEVQLMSNIEIENNNDKVRFVGMKMILKAKGLIIRAQNCREIVSVDMQLNCLDAKELYSDKFMTCSEEGKAQYYYPEIPLTAIAVIVNKTTMQ